MRSLRPPYLRPALALVLAALGVVRANAQVPGVSREEMWPAPTEEDWAKPCLIQWQRSYADALAVSKTTSKAVLVCINMDGEIASEHYAGIRYRQPEIATLYEPYVCVIASVYRHSPRDYDESGQRIECPRFGTVTCGEHIGIEPGLYAEFMDGRRVAPRHIGVELDGAEMYDVFYAFDTDTIFNTLREGIENRPEPPPDLFGDRPLLERVTSKDVRDREVVEQAYRSGSREVRRQLLERAIAAGQEAPLDLLRLALLGLDLEHSRLAREALAATSSPQAVELLAQALRVPMSAEEREALIVALERIGVAHPRAQTLAAVHRGLSARSKAVDVERWNELLAAASPPPPPPVRSSLETAIDYRVDAGRERPEDAAAQLDVAEACLELALDPRAHSRVDSRRAARTTALLFEDARRAAQRAEELGLTQWRTQAVLAIAADHLDDRAEAFARAEVALEGMPAGAEGRNAFEVLTLFAASRQERIATAIAEGAPWPPEWLSDLNATYRVLAEHPLGGAGEIQRQVLFLFRLGADATAEDVLRAGLERFPDAWGLHDLWRGHLIALRGAAGLEQSYDEMLRAVGASPNLEWFAGYASLVAAEFQRRNRRTDEALAAYGRATRHYDAAILKNPASRASADHYAAIALAGRARIAYGLSDESTAVDELLASFARSKDAASTLDGLGFSAVSTAQMVLSRLRRESADELADSLEAALLELDPEHLLLPEFESVNPDDPRRRRRLPERRTAPPAEGEVSGETGGSGD